MHSIATRKGDEGLTGLLYGQRVPKDHPQIEAVGCFDEFNAALGYAKATCPLPERTAQLEQIQKDLVSLMGEVVCAEADTERYLSSKFSRIGETELARIDKGVADLEAKNLKMDGWATPGANLHAAAIDLARSIGRRAERRLVALPASGKSLRPVVRQYVNRVCDLLWLMARDAETAN